MPHVTLKGFFRTAARPAELEARLRAALRGRPAVTLYNAGPVALGPGTVALDVDRDPGGGRNGALRALHLAAFDAMAPLVAPGCEFTAVEHAGEAFRAHLTLAMADLPPDRTDALVALTAREPLGPPVSPATEVSLYVFESDDWAGRWWETLTWSTVAACSLA
jgi:hypothetical protein